MRAMVLFFSSFSLLESNHVDVVIKSLGILRNLLTEKEVRLLFCWLMMCVMIIVG